MWDIIKSTFEKYGAEGLCVVAVICIAAYWVYVRLKAAVQSEYNRTELTLKNNYDAKLKYIEHEYAQKLEKYSTELRHNSELALKDFEAKISERDIKLSGRFKYQREAIEIIYGKIMAINDGIQNYGLFLFSISAKQKGDILSKALQDLVKSYYPKSIYLEQQSEINVHKFIRAAVLLKKIYTEINELENTQPQTHGILTESNEKLTKVPEMEANVELALIEIIDDFRRILGLQTCNKKTA